MKKNYSVFIFLLCLSLSLSFTFSLNKKVNVFADGYEETKSKSAILLDADTKTVIYSKNEKQRYPIASMCKVMTLLLCFENIDNGNLSLDEDIQISESASGMGGSQVFLEANACYKTSELLKSITVASANDACVAMAERLYGSENNFVDKMNEKAKELGMENTNFTNCTGLPKSGQYSCALDVSTMFGELIRHKDYFMFSKIWTDEINHPKGRVTEISNTNKLIRFYDGCDCGKTGFTSEAGHCLVASAVRNGMRLIGVVISSPDSKTRFKEVSSFFNYGFNNFESKTLIDASVPLELNVDVKGGKKEKVNVKAENSIKIFSEKKQKRSFEIDFVPFDDVKAPIKVGEVLGKLTVYENGIELYTVNVVSREEIDCRSYFDCIRDIIFNWSISV